MIYIYTWIIKIIIYLFSTFHTWNATQSNDAHACIYLRKISYVHILNMFTNNIHYMNINIYMEIFSIYILYMCVHAHTYVNNKSYFVCD